jgi:hypothetical protein
MAIVSEVFIKANPYTPQRFWELALRTETKHARWYDDMGYTYSENHTKEYNNLSDDDKKRVSFTFINDKKQV